MYLKKLFFVYISLSFLSACAHISQRIHKLPVKASKPKVLKTLGQPVKIQRQDGKDYWTYKFVIEGRHYTQVLIFKEGMLYKKERLKPYSLKSF